MVYRSTRLGMSAATFLPYYRAAAAEREALGVPALPLSVCCAALLGRPPPALCLVPPNCHLPQIGRHYYLHIRRDLRLVHHLKDDVRGTASPNSRQSRERASVGLLWQGYDLPAIRPIENPKDLPSSYPCDHCGSRRLSSGAWHDAKLYFGEAPTEAWRREERPRAVLSHDPKRPCFRVLDKAEY